MRKLDDYLKTDFKPSKCLPPNMRIEKSGTHLYRIGLSLTPVLGVERYKSRHPLFIFLTLFYYWTRSILVLLLPEQSLDFYRFLGDFGFVFGTRVHFALTCIGSLWLGMFSQILNLYIHTKKIEPTYLRLFHMMAGHISPQSIGLTDKAVVVSLLRKAKLLFLLGDTVPLSLGFSIIGINTFSFYFNSSMAEIILIVIPNCIGWFVVVNMVYSLILWQLIHFHLITYYLKSKLKAINQILEDFTRNPNKQPISFPKIWSDLNQIYSEISEYDHIYWSKFLAFVWMTCATILSTLSFFIIFGEMMLIIRIFCLYFDLFFVSMLLLVVENCATVYHEINKSYKVLNSVTTLWKQKSVSKGWKLMVLIEKIGQKRIGFHCWKLFIINSFRGYEIISMCVIAFLKVTEMSLYK